MPSLIIRKDIDFMGKRKFTAVLSTVLLIVSVGFLIARGLNFGIDFTGGVLVEVGYPESAEISEIRQRLDDGDFGDAMVQNFGSARDVLIRVLPREGVNDSQVGDRILALLESGDTGVILRRVEFVGPQVGEELTERGGLAMLFALILILIYIMFRFQWKFAVGSVAALVHDVIITIGFFSVFQIPFDLSVLAAVLAVIGYSLNDTIVVFDRIRENFRKAGKESADRIMNTSVNQTLGRTLITSMTTLLVLTALLLLGGQAVRGFSIALIIGVVVGTYSSIYIASTAALALNVAPADLLEPVKVKEIDDTP